MMLPPKNQTIVKLKRPLPDTPTQVDREEVRILTDTGRIYSKLYYRGPHGTNPKRRSGRWTFVGIITPDIATPAEWAERRCAKDATYPFTLVHITPNVTINQQKRDNSQDTDDYLL